MQRRYGGVVELRPERAEEYVRVHEAIWPGVGKMIRDANIRNYSVFLRKLPDGKLYLFGYFEYVGNDYDADMKRLAADPETQRWWDLCKPMHVPLADRAEGEWWASMREVFHQD
jgi:L-rhamnose mutarotase